MCISACASVTQEESNSKGAGGASDLPQISGHLVRSFVADPARRPVATTGRGLLFIVRTLCDGLGAVTRDTVSYLATKLLMGKPGVGSGVGMDMVEWEETLDRMTGTERISGSVRFLVDGSEFFPSLESALSNSDESIKIQTYIFDNDDVAVRVADLLRAKSEEVPVQVLMDGIGTISGGLVESVSLPRDHVPPRSITRYLNEASNVRARLLGNPFFLGDHRKAMIVDGELAYVGGMNIGREYQFDWHDMMVELQGSIVDVIEHDFDKTWGQYSMPFARFGKESTDLGRGDAELRVLYTELHDPQIYLAQLEAIRRARDYIYVENAYFSDDATRFALISARRRGVDVRVVLPSRGDSGPMDKSNVLAANSLHDAGVRVYIYPGMSHIKAMVVDGWACFGSANLDRLSLKLNREMNLATSSPEVVSTLVDRIFLRDFKVSRELESPLPVRWHYPLYEFLADLVL
jgi:cardiolipin synthase